MVEKLSRIASEAPTSKLRASIKHQVKISNFDDHDGQSNEKLELSDIKSS